jgi:L-ascorbate metabolism protein UlaG (beta-lactamase superfamily)
MAQPAPVSAWKASQNHLIVIAHPYGTTVVQGTAGFYAEALQGIQADVVMMGIQLLETLGERYAEEYWQALVTTTGARHVIPIHFDDFTRPFGETVLLPRFIEDIVNVSTWLEKFRDRWDRDTHLHWPEFGKQVVLFAGAPPEA